jgi:hypothetical protein
MFENNFLEFSKKIKNLNFSFLMKIAGKKLNFAFVKIFRAVNNSRYQKSERKLLLTFFHSFFFAL